MVRCEFVEVKYLKAELRRRCGQDEEHEVVDIVAMEEHA